MPKRIDLQSNPHPGLQAIVIGQAAEFDYSGTQAVPALHEEWDRLILVDQHIVTGDLAQPTGCA